MKDGFIQRYPWVVMLIILVLFGVVGRMDYIDQVRIEYRSKCPNGTIDVEGDNVICTGQNVNPQIVGVIK